MNKICSTLLVVDDELELSSLLKEYLEENNYKCLQAASAEEALKILSDKNNDISLVISDIKMPQKNGLELFSEYKKNIDTENSTPFVLMTGHADIISVQNAFKLGVDELIAKPFDLEAVKLVIDYLLDQSTDEQNETYFSVNIDDFMLSKTSDYNIFLKVSEKYVKVTKSGQDFTAQRLENFSRKGVIQIYLNSTDFAQYTNLQFAIAKSMNIRPLDIARKTKIMNHLICSISQSSLYKSLDQSMVESSLQAFESYTQTALNNSQLTHILNQLMVENPGLAEQASLKAIISAAIAASWKWHSPKVQSRIILAALLSDISLKDLKFINTKKKIEFTSEEKKAYEEHPFKSYQLLSQIQGMPDEILQVALQHHENLSGMGFPQKLVKARTHAYTKLIHGVGEFLETLYQQDDPTDYRLALDHLYKFQRKIISEQVIKSLYLMFGITVPKGLEGLLLPTETTRVA